MKLIRRTLLLVLFIVLLFLVDYFRVKSKYKNANDQIKQNQNNSEYFYYFENVYKYNNGIYNIDHSKRKFLSLIEKDFGDVLSLDSLKLFSKRYMDIYFNDPFNGEFKYYPIYNESNNIIGYMLLSSGIDGTLNNDFNSKIMMDQIKDFRLYKNNYKFNYLDHYFGDKDLLVSSSLK